MGRWPGSSSTMAQPKDSASTTAQLEDHHGYLLQCVPDEVLFQMLACLPLQDLCNAARTCRLLRRMVSDGKTMFLRSTRVEGGIEE